MDKQELLDRTKLFALRIIKLVRALPKSMEGRNIGDQLFRSGTSVAANYRAACRARSKVEFISKLGIVIEEGDESIFWMEIIIEIGLLKQQLVTNLLKEAHELTAIMVSSRNSAIKNLKS